MHGKECRERCEEELSAVPDAGQGDDADGGEGPAAYEVRGG